MTRLAVLSGTKEGGGGRGGGLGGAGEVRPNSSVGGWSGGSSSHAATGDTPSFLFFSRALPSRYFWQEYFVREHIWEGVDLLCVSTAWEVFAKILVPFSSSSPWLKLELDAKSNDS